LKHFEDTWNESEAEVKSVLSTDNRVFEIKELLDSLLEELSKESEGNKENITAIYGEIIHQLTGISKDHKINSDYALKIAIENAKIDKYG
jgi:hypothetical protein